jgi:hypothetical protein
VLAAAQKRCEFGPLGLAQFDPIAYIHPCVLVRHGRTAESDGRRESRRKNLHASIWPLSTSIRACVAEADMQEYFRVSPPSVHQMVLTLEREGFIRRQPRTPRSIELLVDPAQLPELL